MSKNYKYYHMVLIEEEIAKQARHEVSNTQNHENEF